MMWLHLAATCWLLAFGLLAWRYLALPDGTACSWQATLKRNK